ncbi:MAG: hypothetical protein II956_13285 [Bacteroidales bacterium]|nr:hypothetical protein [Bacteroidales bacterium]
MTVAIIIILSLGVVFSCVLLQREKKRNLLSLNSLQSQIHDLEKQAEVLKADFNALQQQTLGYDVSLSFLRRNILTPKNYIKSFFPEFFILERAQDKDFYKFYRQGDYLLACCGRCGASGVNGLVKSILNIVFLDEILEKNDLSKISSGDILDMVREKYSHLEDNSSDNSSRINFSICIINQKERTLEFSGAYSNLCIVRKSYPGTSRKEVDVHEFTGDKMNFAVSFGHRKNYSVQTIGIEKDDKIYLQTGTDFSRQMFIKNANATMKEQAALFETSLEGDSMLIGIALKVKALNENQEK